MTTYKFGDVVLVQFPQSGTTARKQRPGIVVLDIGDADLVVAPVTSKARFLAGDRSIGNLTGSGLVLPSWVRLAKVVALLKSDVVRKLGRLSDAERAEIAREWQTLYGGFAS
jgi:mRNA interferase MazF